MLFQIVIAESVFIYKFKFYLCIYILNVFSTILCVSLFQRRGKLQLTRFDINNIFEPADHLSVGRKVFLNCHLSLLFFCLPINLS